MGYNIDITGGFTCSPTLSDEHRRYLEEFNEKRRMKRNPELLEDVPDPAREAVGLPLGEHGEFYTGSTAFAGQDDDHPSVLETRPKTQPGPWCPWRPTPDGKYIVWDEQTSKHRRFDSWLEWIIGNLLAPWGYDVAGEAHWEGEAPDDVGILRVRDNRVTLETPSDEPLPEQIDELEHIIHTGDENERLAALKALASLATEQRDALKLIGVALGDDSSSIRKVAAHLLEELAPSLQARDLATLANLMNGIKDDSPRVRAACAHVVGMTGIYGTLFASVLQPLTEDPDELVRERASEALENVVRPYQQMHAFKFAAGNEELVDEFRDDAHFGEFQTEFLIQISACERFVRRCGELQLLIVGVTAIEIADDTCLPGPEISRAFPELPHEPSAWSKLVERGTLTAREVISQLEDNPRLHIQFHVFSRDQVG